MIARKYLNKARQAHRPDMSLKSYARYRAHYSDILQLIALGWLERKGLR